MQILLRAFECLFERFEEQCEVALVIDVAYVLREAQHVRCAMRPAENIMVARHDSQPVCRKHVVLCKDLAHQIKIIDVRRAYDIARDKKMVASFFKYRAEKNFERFEMLAVKLAAQVGIGNMNESKALIPVVFPGEIVNATDGRFMPRVRAPAVCIQYYCHIVHNIYPLFFLYRTLVIKMDVSVVEGNPKHPIAAKKLFSSL